MTKGNPNFNGNVDSYLHESALADNPPSKETYVSESGARNLLLPGVPEHRNDATEKKYLLSIRGQIQFGLDTKAFRAFVTG